MKILQVLPELNIGGVERATLDLAKAIVARGHEAFVVSAGGVLVPELDESGAIHIKLAVGQKNLGIIFTLKKMFNIIKTIQPDIIHVRSRLPAWVVYVAMCGLSKKQRPVVVSTFHGLYSTPWYSQIMSFSDHIISISDTVTEYIQVTYGVALEKITRIYCGCDTEIFYEKPICKQWLENWYQIFPQTRDKIILTLPARITKLKGIDSMIELISRLDNRYHALIVGPVHEKKRRYWEAVQALVFEKKIQSRITFCGARQDIDQIYLLSDVVYNLSNQPESFGRTVCEACNMGTKVIAWARGGPKEILEVLFPVGLVEPGDMAALVNKTYMLTERTHMQKPIVGQFTSTQLIAKTMRLYQQLLSSE